jgi:rubrerythrin
VSGRTEANVDPAAPKTMALWRCIACGNMGRLRDCTGQCAFRQVIVVEGEAYADLHEAGEMAQALLEAAGRVIAALAEIGDDGAALEARPAAAMEPTQDRPPVWLCDACGMVEAPQECLGVCVRPVRDFVAAQDYDALARAATARIAQAGRARALLSGLARTRPREGQWARAARHFSTQAGAVARRQEPA